MIGFKRSRSRIAAFLSGACATAFCASSVDAAKVEVIGLDLETGKETVLAEGEVDATPKFLLPDLARGGSAIDVLIDECGSIYRVEDDRRIVDRRYPEAAIQGVEFIFDKERYQPTMTLFENGRLYEHGSVDGMGYDAGDWERMGDAFERRPNDLGEAVADWPEDKTFVAAWRHPGHGNTRLFVVDDEGTLFGLHRDEAGLVLKPIGASGAHGGTVALVVIKGRAYTLRSSGELYGTDLGGSGWGSESTRPERIGSESMKGATVLLPAPLQEDWMGLHLMAVDDSGKLTIIKAQDGSIAARTEATDLASPKAIAAISIKDRFDHQLQYDLAFARASGATADCVEKTQLLADIADQKKDAASRVDSAKAAFDELAKQVQAYEEALDAIEQRTIAIDEAKHMIAKSTLGDRMDDLSGQIESLGEAFEAFEEDEVAPLAQARERFLSAYGSDDGQLEPELASSGCCRGGTLTGIPGLLEDFARLRKTRAQTAMSYLDSVFSGDKVDPRRVYFRPALSTKEMAGFEKQAKSRRADYDQAREVATLVRERLDGELEQAVGFESKTEAWYTKLDEALAASRQKGAEANAKAVWPQRMSGFQGPGDAAELEQIALGFVQAETGRSYFEAHVCRGWRPIQKDRLGRPKDYAIDMCMVRADGDDGEFARTVYVTLYTVNAQMAPPFSHFAVSEKSRIAMERRPGGSPDWSGVPAAPTGSGGGGGGGGLLGGLMRLLTGLALAGTGLVLAGGVVARRFGGLAPIVAPLAANAPIVGTFAVAIGGLGLLGAAFTLSPIANLLPVGGCLLAGLLVWRLDSKSLERLPAQVRAGIERGLTIVAPLAGRSEMVGLATLAMAPIHWLLGGLPFV